MKKHLMLFGITSLALSNTCFAKTRSSGSRKSTPKVSSAKKSSSSSSSSSKKSSSSSSSSTSSSSSSKTSGSTTSSSSSSNTNSSTSSSSSSQTNGGTTSSSSSNNTNSNTSSNTAHTNSTTKSSASSHTTNDANNTSNKSTYSNTINDNSADTWTDTWNDTTAYANTGYTNSIFGTHSKYTGFGKNMIHTAWNSNYSFVDYYLYRRLFYRPLHSYATSNMSNTMYTDPYSNIYASTETGMPMPNVYKKRPSSFSLLALVLCSALIIVLAGLLIKKLRQK